MLKSFYAQALLILVTGGLYVLVGHLLVNPDWVPVNSIYANVLLFAISLVSYYMVTRSEAPDDFAMNNRIMASISIRLLAAGGILVGYYFLINDQNVAFTANFFLFYLFYTWFEIRALLSNLRANSRK